jgi:hypothetical protein
MAEFTSLGLQPMEPESSLFRMTAMKQKFFQFDGLLITVATQSKA